MFEKRQGQWISRKPQCGEEIMVLRSALGGLLNYSHHGVYFGDNEVYQFHGDLSHVLNARIDKTSLEYFRTGDGIYPQAEIKVYVPGGNECSLPSAIVRERAISRINTRGYADNKHHYLPFSNNCEHFATWACYGTAQCYQFNFAWLFTVLQAALFILLAQILFAKVPQISVAVNALITCFMAQIGFATGIICTMFKLHKGLNWAKISWALVWGWLAFLSHFHETGWRKCKKNKLC